MSIKERYDLIKKNQQEEAEKETKSLRENRHAPQKISKQHGKRRHVSRNTLTKSRRKLGIPS